MPPREPDLALLLDERELRALILRFGAALDHKDWAAYAGTFAVDGEFEIMGQRRVGRAEIAAGPRRGLSKFARLQHIANETIDVDGDQASGQWYLFAVHVPSGARPDEHADIGGCYRFRALRTAAGWRFSEVLLDVLWNAGTTFTVDDHVGV
jgi:SnoaL-like domain